MRQFAAMRAFAWAAKVAAASASLVVVMLAVVAGIDVLRQPRLWAALFGAVSFGLTSAFALGRLLGAYIDVVVPRARWLRLQFAFLAAFLIANFAVIAGIYIGAMAIPEAQVTSRSGVLSPEFLGFTHLVGIILSSVGSVNWLGDVIAECSRRQGAYCVLHEGTV